MAVNGSSGYLSGSIEAPGPSVINDGLNLRPNVVSGGGLCRCVVTLCLFLCVGHDWAQDIEVESAGTLCVATV